MNRILMRAIRNTKIVTNKTKKTTPKAQQKNYKYIEKTPTGKRIDRNEMDGVF